MFRLKATAKKTPEGSKKASPGSFAEQIGIMNCKIFANAYFSHPKIFWTESFASPSRKRVLGSVKSGFGTPA